MNKRLNVFISTLDRTILTEKCIRGVIQNSASFDNIDIYAYDTGSTMNADRLAMFERLLKSKSVKQYTYLSKDSMNNIFGKAYAFNMWITAMDIHISEKNIDKAKRLNCVDYYLVIDNDMLLSPEWDKCFIEASDHDERTNGITYFTTPFPGGIPNVKRDDRKFGKLKTCEFTTENCGGGSGFWFMSSSQFMRTHSIWKKYKIHEKCYNYHKRHDSETWKAIKNNDGDINYNLSVKTDTPTVIHLGGLPEVGSICVSLSYPGDGDMRYGMTKRRSERFEREIADMSVNELFDRFKRDERTTLW